MFFSIFFWLSVIDGCFLVCSWFGFVVVFRIGDRESWFSSSVSDFVEYSSSVSVYVGVRFL